MKKNTYLTPELTADLPFSIHSIKDLKIIQRINCHGIAFLSGLLTENAKDSLQAITEKTPVTIKKREFDHKETILFCGFPCSFKVKHTGGISQWFLLLKSSSILLDYQKKSRSFQDTNSSYNKLFETILKTYNGDFLDASSHGDSKKQLFIQYEETDWDFIIRAASRIGSAIFPDPSSQQPRLYLGLPKGTTFQEPKIRDSRIIRPDKSLFSCFSSGREYQIGDKVSDHGLSLSITQKVIRLKRGILTFSYEARNSKGLKKTSFYNTRLKGASISGTIIDVKEDKIKLHLSIDDFQSRSKALWFPYTTPYAAEGSTGFYFLPASGESVNLSFATCEEKDALIQFANQSKSASNSKVHHPAIKRLGTSFGKELKMTSDQLLISGVKNHLHLSFHNANGIEIKSHQDIHFKTNKRISSRCKTFEMESQDKIVLATPTSSIIVDDIVHIKG